MEFDINPILTNLVLAVLIAAIPIVVATIRTLVQQQLARLNQQLAEPNYWLLQSIARDFYAAA